MRLVALEEHMATPDVVEAWRRVDPQWSDVGFLHSSTGTVGAALQELGEQRLAAMDESGVDVQVLSLTTPGVQNLDAAEAVCLQGQVNDLLAQAVRARPDRLQAFATLATPDPGAAVRELERAVTRLGMNGAMLFGRTRATWTIPTTGRSTRPLLRCGCRSTSIPSLRRLPFARSCTTASMPTSA